MWLNCLRISPEVAVQLLTGAAAPGRLAREGGSVVRVAPEAAGGKPQCLSTVGRPPELPESSQRGGWLSPEQWMRQTDRQTAGSSCPLVPLPWKS